VEQQLHRRLRGDEEFMRMIASQEEFRSISGLHRG
jgi:hypothetical protein